MRLFLHNQFLISQPDRSAAVPKFGEWDETNPASAEGYTHIFNKVREERQVAAGHVPGTPNGRSYGGVQNQPTTDKAQVYLQNCLILMHQIYKFGVFAILMLLFVLILASPELLLLLGQKMIYWKCGLYSERKRR